MAPNELQPTLPSELPDRYLSTSEVRAFCGNISKMTIYRWVKGRGFPPPFYVTPQKPLWKASKVAAWIERKTTSAPEQPERLPEGKRKKALKRAGNETEGA